jgi:hypothetical protein
VTFLRKRQKNVMSCIRCNSYCIFRFRGRGESDSYGATKEVWRVGMLRSGRRVLGIFAAGIALVVAGSATAHDASAVELTPVANTAAQSFTSVPVAQSAMDLMRAGRAADALALLSLRRRIWGNLPGRRGPIARMMAA